MNLLQRIMPVAAVVAVTYLAWRAAGWGGIALASGGIVMWLLLHFTRAMRVLQRAAGRPVGYCDSAVMLNARLRPQANLLHVVALTRALGEQLGEAGAQPEVFRWTDPGGSHVTCEFQDGKLVKWTLWRPPAGAGGAEAPAPEAGPPPAAP